ncbi:translation initiation factor IF-2 [Candidatus Aerophobetes bacterium Ae_b3b]|nr:MAG: translation initiation factor IF-2 [Candidatus Aerophobetes bacterium Ae_b3b]
MMRVYQLARRLNLSTGKLLKLLTSLGIEAKSSLSSLSPKEVRQLEKLALKKRKPSLKAKKLHARAPIVTLLGHVDHGKTSLLDAVRQTAVTEEEVGGITQRIGASEVEFQGKRIVFIDTPGHEAFTAMRAHGAQVTDIAVLVIAADDGVMPQTVEAIDHARAAKVPIVVAVNKIDKSEAKSDQVKRQLNKYDLTPEEWGGKTICVEVSALTKEGLDGLLEMILLEAEMLELTGDPEGDFKAVVIEGEMDRQKGPCSTLLIQEGSLKIGDILVGGASFGKVRALVDWKGKKLKEAGPPTPVRVLGLSDIGTPGGIFRKVESERKARQLAEEARIEERAKSLTKRDKITLETLYQEQVKEKKALNIILKADTQGSLKALRDVLNNLEDEEVRINVVHGGIGEVNKSDVLLAAASKGIVISFSVGTFSESRSLATDERVEIRSYQVIYEMIDDIKKSMQGLLEPRYEEIEIGEVEVREIFRIPKVGVVAGSYITVGKVVRGSKAKIFRGDEIVGEGVVSGLKRFDKDVSEVLTGLECGVNVEGFNEVRKGDLIKVYETKRVG